MQWGLFQGKTGRWAFLPAASAEPLGASQVNKNLRPLSKAEHESESNQVNIFKGQEEKTEFSHEIKGFQIVQFYNRMQVVRCYNFNSTNISLKNE